MNSLSKGSTGLFSLYVITTLCPAPWHGRRLRRQGVPAEPDGGGAAAAPPARLNFKVRCADSTRAGGGGLLPACPGTPDHPETLPSRGGSNSACLQQEVALHRSLHHPNVVPCRAVLCSEGAPPIPPFPPPVPPFRVVWFARDTVCVSASEREDK